MDRITIIAWLTKLIFFLVTVEPLRLHHELGYAGYEPKFKQSVLYAGLSGSRSDTMLPLEMGRSLMELVINASSVSHWMTDNLPFWTDLSMRSLMDCILRSTRPFTLCTPTGQQSNSMLSFNEAYFYDQATQTGFFRIWGDWGRGGYQNSYDYFHVMDLLKLCFTVA